MFYDLYYFKLFTYSLILFLRTVFNCYLQSVETNNNIYERAKILRIYIFI